MSSPKIKLTATKAITRERMNVLRDMYFSRTPRYKIEEYGFKEWGLGKSRINKMLINVRREMKELAEEDKEKFYERNINYLISIIEQGMTEDNLNAAVSAVKELNKMTGNINNNIDITSNGEKIELSISNKFIPKEED